MASSPHGYRGRAVKGMRDLLPPETRLWCAVEDTARRVFDLYAFEEIRTPIVEETELFVRGVGESSEIVGKQMYTFTDKKGKSLSLRPENTASVARAFVQHRLSERPAPVRLFYIGPQFRYERPQKGRYRQFFQIGAELLGDPGPWSDVEIIVLLMSFLEALGFTKLEAQINTVGDPESRRRYSAALRDYLSPRAGELGEDSRRRLETNPLRILDSKMPAEIALLEDAPDIQDYLSSESQQHFDAVLGGLDELGITYQVQPRLVRGLDYYTRTVFEIASADLGAQNAIVGGGRYDGLIEELGGGNQPAIGFAIGLDRLIEIVPAVFKEASRRAPPALIVPAGSVTTLEAMKLAEEVRCAGVPASVEVSGRSVKAALRRADRIGIELVVLLGDEELRRGQAKIRDFRSGLEVDCPRRELASELQRRLEGRRVEDNS